MRPEDYIREEIDTMIILKILGLFTEENMKFVIESEDRYAALHILKSTRDV